MFWRIEPGGPEGEIQRWAALMAAVANGPLRKRNKQHFTSEDFWPASTWDPLPEEVPTGKAPARQAPDFSHVRGMKYRKPRKE